MHSAETRLYHAQQALGAAHAELAELRAAVNGYEDAYADLQKMYAKLRRFAECHSLTVERAERFWLVPTPDESKDYFAGNCRRAIRTYRHRTGTTVAEARLALGSGDRR